MNASIPPVLALWVLASALAARAQDVPRDSARVAGSVVASDGSGPVAGVMIAFPNRRVFRVTDSSGHFSFAGLTPGRERMRLTHGARPPVESTVELMAGRTVTLTLVVDVALPALETVVVTEHIDRRLRVAGFYERRRLMHARFYTQEQVEERGPQQLTHLLGGTGLMSHCERGACRVVQRFGGKLCEVPIYMDGRWVPDFDLDWVPAHDVSGLEIYRNSAQTPIEFTREGAGCGAVVVWTKDN